jgi:transcriptional regulator with XRE-family HTH domain
MDTTTQTTGIDLKLLRVSRFVSVRQVAQAAGCSRTYVNRIEAAGRPSDRVCAKYLAALARCQPR